MERAKKDNDENGVKLMGAYSHMIQSKIDLLEYVSGILNVRSGPSDLVLGKISTVEAEKFVYQALRFNSDGSLVYNGKSDDSGFYNFKGWSIGSGSYGFFEVNPWTGDVWALWGCEKMSSPALLKSKAKIKHRFTSKELKEYSRLQAIRPSCITD